MMSTLMMSSDSNVLPLKRIAPVFGQPPLPPSGRKSSRQNSDKKVNTRSGTPNSTLKKLAQGSLVDNFHTINIHNNTEEDQRITACFMEGRDHASQNLPDSMLANPVILFVYSKKVFS